MGVHRLSLVPGSAHVRGSLNEWFLSEQSCMVGDLRASLRLGGGFRMAGDTWAENGVVWNRQSWTFR